MKIRDAFGEVMGVERLAIRNKVIEFAFDFGPALTWDSGTRKVRGIPPCPSRQDDQRSGKLPFSEQGRGLTKSGFCRSTSPLPQTHIVQ